MRDDVFEKPGKEDNDSQNSEQNMTNFDDLESELSKPPDESEKMSLGITKVLRWSSWARVPQVLLPCQVTYVLNSISSGTLSSSIQPDQNFESTDTPSSLAQFTSTCISQSNINMVQNLRKLEATLITKVMKNLAFSNKPFVALTCPNKKKLFKLNTTLWWKTRLGSRQLYQTIDKLLLVCGTSS